MIKFVYFDVGGVIIKDFSGTNKWQELRQDIGVGPEKDAAVREFFYKYIPEVSIGRNVETLVPLLKEEFDIEFPDDYSLLEDIVNRFEKNQSIWELVNKAKEKYKVGILTNMYPGMLDMIRDREILPSVDWDVVIDSSVEGVLKPQKEIYQLAERRSGFKGNEIFFVDDNEENIEAAKIQNWHTYFYDSSNMERSSKELSKKIC